MKNLIQRWLKLRNIKRNWLESSCSSILFISLSRHAFELNKVSFSNQDWDMSTPHNNNNNYCFLSCFYSLALFLFLFYLFYLFFFIFNPISNKRDPWAWFYLFSTFIHFILLDVFIQIRTK